MDMMAMSRKADKVCFIWPWSGAVDRMAVIGIVKGEKVIQ